MNNDKIIYFVTGNKHKYHEIVSSFKKEQLKWIPVHRDLKTIEPQILDLKEIAIFKLKSVKQEMDSSYFIEDAGLFIETPLKGFPGVFSSYIFKTLGNEGILKLINNFQDSIAYFRAVIALYFKPLNKILTFIGETKGKISPVIRGNKGFGFDPIFIPDDFPKKTFAELSVDQKNMISHRGKAIGKLINFLKKY
jgi:XTP/dITP diphosphohydrolase